MIIINVEDEKKSILELNGIAPFNAKSACPRQKSINFIKVL